MDKPRANIPAYIFDASSLINLERQNKLWHLSEHGDLVVIHHRTAKEVAKSRTDLAEWISKHPDRITYTFLTEEGKLYIRLRQQKIPKVQDPDAIAIAIAWYRKGILVCDDTAALQKANHYSVTCLTVNQFVQKIEPQML